MRRRWGLCGRGREGCDSRPPLREGGSGCAFTGGAKPPPATGVQPFGLGRQERGEG